MSVEKCCNRNELFPFILWNFVNFNITITGNTVVVDINFKSLNFKNLTKILFLFDCVYSKGRLSGETHRNDNNSYFCQLGR